MSIAEIFLTGVGLSMDAVAVSMTDAMVYAKEKRRLMVLPLAFGFFQALMPLLGYFFAGLFAGFVEKFAGALAFLILAFIGADMIYESCKKEEKNAVPSLKVSAVVAQAIATSIDAFAVGASFALMGDRFSENIFFASIFIGAVTFSCSTVALGLGKTFGDALEDKAEAFGGVILIAIGIKSLFQL